MKNPKTAQFFRHFLNTKVIVITYLLVALVFAVIKQQLHGSFNNYLIFKYVFWHTWDLKPLYESYAEYADTNHYGPFFSLIIAPFAILPNWLAVPLWNMFNVSILLWGIFKLPINLKTRQIIAWICLHECITALISFQFNIAITGAILLSFSYMEKQQSVRAAIAIVIGFLVKLYGIVGLAFFLFNKRKVHFLVSLAICFGIGFLLPSILSNPSFIIQSYHDWFQSLQTKNATNEVSFLTNISLLGFILKTTGILINVLYGCAFAGIILLLALLRKKMYPYMSYKLLILSYVLLTAVLFSSSSESPTYIIAFAGVAIWYMVVPRTSYVHALFIFAFVLTSLSPTDIFPKYLKVHYVYPYALKALPCILIWMDISWRLLLYRFNNAEKELT